jgi:catechol 2,3-dioxygenase-like lactoylglutathione lyase family enzyme
MAAMRSAWNHIQMNIEPGNRAFYKELFTLLGWESWHEDDKMLGMGVEGKGSFWFAAAPGKHRTDYDQLGVNHIAVRTEEQKDVDAVAAFLERKHVSALFETPRHRPEFAEGEGQTYYQVMFASPDNLLFEVVYIGAKVG